MRLPRSTRAHALVLATLAVALVATASALAQPAPASVQADADAGDAPLTVIGTRLVTLSVRYCHAPLLGGVEGDAVVRFDVDDPPDWVQASVVPDTIEFPLDASRSCTPRVDVTLILTTPLGATPANATGNVTVTATADAGTLNAGAEDVLVFPVRAPGGDEAPGLVTADVAAESEVVDVVPQSADDAPPVTRDAFPVLALALAGALGGAGLAAWWTRP